jgi:hypothetical protein
MSALATRRLVLRLAGVTALTPSLLGRAWATEPAGSVVGLLGQCLVQRQGNSTALRMGETVLVSDTITVPADGKLKLRMEDGSVVSLAAGTSMTVAAYQADAGGQRQSARLSLGEGLLRAVVTPVNRPATFEVITAVGTAGVRSTDWFIEAKPGAATVGVLTGSVVLTSAATGRSVTIPGRWGARLEVGRDPVPARVWSPDEFRAVISRTDIP